MIKLTPIKLFLPGVFLLILGIGNILTGAGKVEQFDLVVAELSALETTDPVLEPSVLRRIESVNRTLDRRGQLLQQARAKRNLYQLPILGGKIFVGLGLLLLVLSGLLRTIIPLP